MQPTGKAGGSWLSFGVKRKPMEVSVEQEIKQIQMDKSHVVILGAGASYAAFLHGDKNSVRLPLMNNFVDILGLNNLLSQPGIDFKTDNFEAIYNQLHQNDAHREIREELECGPGMIN